MYFSADTARAAAWAGTDVGRFLAEISLPMYSTRESMRGVLLVDSLEAKDIRRLVLGRELSGFIPSAGFMLDPPPFDSGAH